MSRRVVIGILILLIIGVLGGTVVLIFSRLRKTQEVSQTPQTSSLPGANNGGQQIVDPTGDADADGLINADEKIWGSNPNNPDTDADGFKDGEEVQTNHNPTVASPNDKLPPGFIPGQNIVHLEGSAPATQSFESFFADNVDLTGGTKNLTQEYAKTVPDKDKNPVTLAQFIQTQPIVTSLPRLNDAAIITQETSPPTVIQYLSLAGNLETLSDQPHMRIAMSNFLDDKNTYGFVTLAESVEAFQGNIQNLSVPTEAKEYHKLLIGYCKLLSSTLRQISNYSADQVKALVALRQLDVIDRQYYPLIIQERARLLGLAQ